MGRHLKQHLLCTSWWSPVACWMSPALTPSGPTTVSAYQRWSDWSAQKLEMGRQKSRGVYAIGQGRTTSTNVHKASGGRRYLQGWSRSGSSSIDQGRSRTEFCGVKRFRVRMKPEEQATLHLFLRSSLHGTQSAVHSQIQIMAVKQALSRRFLAVEALADQPLELRVSTYAQPDGPAAPVADQVTRLFR